jgi:predicted nucleic acid-binding protein
MIVVSNTTPLIGLASIKRFSLLQQLFGEIHIPQAVFNEAVTARSEKEGAKKEVSSAAWIRTISIQDRLAVEELLDELDLGEAETIVLGHEINADLILMDEKKGRRKLNQLGMPKIGTVGILLKAKQVGLVATIREDLMDLREKGFSISQLVIDAVLEEAGER